MSRKSVKILDVPVNNVTLVEAVSMIEEYLTEGGSLRIVFTPNSEMLARAREDNSFARLLGEADLNVPDGIGLIYASRILKTPLKERVAGFDLLKSMLVQCEKKGYSCYLLGGRTEIVGRAVEVITGRYQKISICGYHHGYFGPEKAPEIVRDINDKRPDLLFVGMGVPRQEEFIVNHRSRLKAGVALTVGGSFDVLAGEVKRAPPWMQKAGLEWLYRLLKQPSRLSRVMSLPRFVYYVFREKYNFLL